MLELSAALIIAIALNVYVLTGGADYGGGVWDLAATGSQTEQQRQLTTILLSRVALIETSNSRHTA